MKLTIKQIRAGKNLTQRQMAELLGVHRDTYLKMEKYPEKISLKMAKRIAEISGYDFDNIFFGV